jgi:hypothetical protein
MRITIDTEGAEYSNYDLMKLSHNIQECWDKMGRGLKEVYSMNIDTFKYQEIEKNKQKQEKAMQKAKTGDI